MTRAHRLAEFVRRLRQARPARSFDEAFGQIFRILNQVEDEFSEVSYNPLAAKDDGRLYPPLWDYVLKVKNRPKLTRLRSRAHTTFIGENGSIQIVDLIDRRQIISKAGEDGIEATEL